MHASLLLFAISLASVSSTPALAALLPRSMSPVLQIAAVNDAGASVDPSFTASIADPQVIGVTANGSVLVSARGTDHTRGSLQFLWLRYDGLSGATITLPPDARVLAVLPDSHLIISDPPYLFCGNGHAAGLALPPAFNSSQPLTGAVVQPDGRFVLAQGGQLARFQPDGSIDRSFVFDSAQMMDPTIRHLSIDAKGNIYLIVGRQRPAIFRLMSDGTVDSHFICTDVAAAGSNSHEVAAHPLNDGRLLITESDSESIHFEMRSGTGTPDQEWSRSGECTAWSCPAIDPDGFIVSVETDHMICRRAITRTGLSEAIRLSPDNGSISGYLVTPGGNMMVSGTFTSWAGHTTAGLALLQIGTSRNAKPEMRNPQRLARAD